MKKIVLIATAIMLFMTTSASFAKDSNKGRGSDDNRRGGHGGYSDDHSRGHGNQDKDDDYHKYGGYRSKSRYDNHQHDHFRNYKYNGHWNSWESWEHYKTRHPHYIRYGHYERYNNQLFFLFNDGMNSFMFSIGR